MRNRAAAVWVATFVGCAPTFAQPPVASAPAALCVVDTLHAGFPQRWSGTHVGQITIRARNVETPNGILGTAAHALHRPTHLGVVSHELGFAPGGLIDSLAVLESVRRLRRTSLFSEVLVEGTQCGERTDLTLWTRDAWSVRTAFRTGNGSTRASMTETNLFGTGRRLSLVGEQLEDRRAFAVGYVDPYLFETRLRGAALLRTYTDGRAWSWSVRTRELSPQDPWRAALVSAQLRRLSVDSAARTSIDIERRANALSVSRLVYLQPLAVYAVVAGVEEERAHLAVTGSSPSLGNAAVRREFTAPLLGLSRRSMDFRAIDWLVPGQPPAELPVGVEGEFVTGIGREINTNARITHLDGWIGATALLTPGTVVTGDVWSSGYWISDSVSNGALRLSGALFQRARRGMWIVRASSERIFNPDPDVFALSTTDPMLRALAPRARLAESAVSVTAERSMHLYAREGRWALDGGIFANYSERHRSVDALSVTTLNLQAVLVGIGLRHVRNQPTQAPLRIDIARPVWRSARLADRWIVVFSTAAWINSGKMRDGLREAR